MTNIAQSNIPLPECLYIEVTNRCNLKCRTCMQYRGMPEKPRDLSGSEAKAIIDQVPGLKRAVLHGIGEPLLNCDLERIIAYLKEKDAYVLFNSNALFLDRDRAKEILKSGLDELRISMDAATESTYARVRGTAQFYQVSKNVASFLALRKGSGRTSPKVSIWMVGTRENISDLPKLIKLAARLRVDEVYLQRLVYPMNGYGQGLARKENTIIGPSPEIEEIIRTSMILSRELEIPFKASGLVSPIQSLVSGSKLDSPWTRCRRPWQSTYITAWGNVLPCCIAPFSTGTYSGLIFGNVFGTGLKEIWQGDKYTEFRERHHSPDPPECCAGCGIDWSL